MEALIEQVVGACMRAVRRMLVPQCLIAFVALAVQAEATERFALLIGNQSYAPQVGRLTNPINDIKLVAKALTDIGFKSHNITVVENADRITMLDAIDAYVDRLSLGGHDAVGFFYYSGHGVANKRDRRNYLIPVGVERLDRRVWFKAIALNDVVSKLSQLAPNAAHFVVFDACRNLLNAPSRGGKGFVPIATRRGMLIAFSTDPGETASDEGGGSGPYAAALAAELTKSGQHHLDVFQNVKEKVYRTTRAQVPWTRDGMLERVYLAGRERASLTPSTQSLLKQAEIVHWNTVKDSDDPAVIRTYLTKYPNGEFALLAQILSDKLGSEASDKRLALTKSRSESTSSSRKFNKKLGGQTQTSTNKQPELFRKVPNGGIVLTSTKWDNITGYRRVSQKEAIGRLAGYTVIYGNGSREYHAPDGQTKIWRKKSNSFYYGTWKVGSSGRLSYRYGSRKGCWGYILYNPIKKQFRVDWRKAVCQFGFSSFIEGEHLR